MKRFNILISILCAAAVMAGGVALSAAEGANVTYSGNSGKFIFEPGSDRSPTDLFPEFKNVMPGASLTQKITLCNRADDQVKVTVYLRSLGSADERYNDFLNQLTLTVTADTDTPLFEAAADKTAGLTDWVCLGTLCSGGEVDLTVTLDVPATLDNAFQKQTGEVKWQFVAEEFPLEEPTWVCPENEKHSCHIEEKDGISVFVCDDCGREEPVKCDVCGGHMHEVLIITVGGETYTACQSGDGRYQTEDGRAEFCFNDRKIMDCYTVGGVKTDVRNVSEYTVYQYYECLNDSRHHTDPKPPTPTGDTTRWGLWLVLAALSGGVLTVLLSGKRRRGRMPC